MCLDAIVERYRPFGGPVLAYKYFYRVSDAWGITPWQLMKIDRGRWLQAHKGDRLQTAAGAILRYDRGWHAFSQPPLLRADADRTARIESVWLDGVIVKGRQWDVEVLVARYLYWPTPDEQQQQTAFCPPPSPWQRRRNIRRQKRRQK